MSNLICAAIHFVRCVHFIYWFRQRRQQTPPPPPPSSLTQSNPPPFRNVNRNAPDSHQPKHPSNKNIMKIKSEKNMFFHFIVFYCLFCARSLNRSLSSSDCLVVDAECWCWQRCCDVDTDEMVLLLLLLIAWQLTLLIFLLALFASTLIRSLTFHPASSFTDTPQ